MCSEDWNRHDVLLYFVHTTLEVKERQVFSFVYFFSFGFHWYVHNSSKGELLLVWHVHILCVCFYLCEVRRVYWVGSYTAVELHECLLIMGVVGCVSLTAGLRVWVMYSIDHAYILGFNILQGECRVDISYGWPFSSLACLCSNMANDFGVNSLTQLCTTLKWYIWLIR